MSIKIIGLTNEFSSNSSSSSNSVTVTSVTVPSGTSALKNDFIVFHTHNLSATTQVERVVGSVDIHKSFTLHQDKYNFDGGSYSGSTNNWESNSRIASPINVKISPGKIIKEIVVMDLRTPLDPLTQSLQFEIIQSDGSIVLLGEYSGDKESFVIGGLNYTIQDGDTFAVKNNGADIVSTGYGPNNNNFYIYFE